MFIAHLFIRMDLKPEIWTTLLYLSQPASGCAFHSRVQFPVHKIFIPPQPKGKDGASLEAKWTYIQKPSEKAALFSLLDEERGLVVYTWSKLRNTVHGPVCWDSSHLPVTSISCLLAHAKPWISRIRPRNTSSFSDFSHDLTNIPSHVILLAAASPSENLWFGNSLTSGIPQKETLRKLTWLSVWNHLSDGPWITPTTHYEKEDCALQFHEEDQLEDSKISLTLMTNSGLVTKSTGLGWPWAYPFWQSTEWMDTQRRNDEGEKEGDMPFFKPPPKYLKHFRE